MEKEWANLRNKVAMSPQRDFFLGSALAKANETRSRSTSRKEARKARESPARSPASPPGAGGAAGTVNSTQGGEAVEEVSDDDEDMVRREGG